MRIRRLEPLLILLFFGLPLFFGLGQTDLRVDESIYSFAVDRMLETGDWLIPRSSPDDDAAFLEKPPLKMWIVAAPIAAGWLPHDEFGLRFWDPVFGALGFLYIFLIGRRLAGSLCGLTAVLLLFGHSWLIFEHGLRSNNMEGALFLAYAAGVYHYLAWELPGQSRPRLHVWALALYFVLGLLTKFVAIAFLGLALGLATLGFGSVRRRLWQQRRIWTEASVGAVVLSVPWFLYAWWVHGSYFWRVLFGVHVYTRFTSSVDPAHLQPWYYYFTTAYQEFAAINGHLLVVPGLVLLLVETIRRRWLDGSVLLLWALVPLALISAGTSKLYHYAYPFLPAFALAGGFTVHVLLQAIWWVMTRAGNGLARVWPDWGAGGWAVPRPKSQSIVDRAQGGLAAAGLDARTTATAVVLALLIWATITAVAPFAGFDLGDGGLLTHQVTLRVMVAALGGLLFAGTEPLPALRLTLALVTLLPASIYGYAYNTLPTRAYKGVVEATHRQSHPIRSLRDCVARIGEADDPGAPILYVDSRRLLHPLNYYFRALRPWVSSEGGNGNDTLFVHSFTPTSQKPSLLPVARYEQFLAHLQVLDDGWVDELAQVSHLAPDGVRETARQEPLKSVQLYDYVLLLPGAYGACAV